MSGPPCRAVLGDPHVATSNTRRGHDWLWLWLPALGPSLVFSVHMGPVYLSCWHWSTLALTVQAPICLQYSLRRGKTSCGTTTAAFSCQTWECLVDHEVPFGIILPLFSHQVLLFWDRSFPLLDRGVACQKMPVVSGWPSPGCR